VGANKGQNNFSAMQLRKVANSKQLITHVLGSIGKGLVFRDANSLVVYVAGKTKMHRTTIARNPEYLRLVLDHLGNQPGAVGFVRDDDANLATLRAKCFTNQLTIKNLYLKIDGLTRTIARLLGNEPTGLSGDASQEGPPMKDEASISDIKFAETAMTLLLLLERLAEKDLGIVVDLEGRQITDVTETGPSRVIAGPPTTKWFLEWLTTHPLLVNLKASVANGAQ
jgi:hypothetical protein